MIGELIVLATLASSNNLNPYPVPQPLTGAQVTHELVNRMDTYLQYIPVFDSPNVTQDGAELVRLVCMSHARSMIVSDIIRKGRDGMERPYINDNQLPQLIWQQVGFCYDSLRASMTTHVKGESYARSP